MSGGWGVAPADVLQKVFDPPLFLHVPKADKKKLLVINPWSFNTYQGALSRCPTAR